MRRLVVILCIVSCCSCGSGSNEGEKGNNESRPKDEEYIEGSYLDGVWSSGCVSPAPGINRIQKFSFNGNDYNESIIWYEDEYCIDIDSSYDHVFSSGTIKYGPTVTTIDGLQARKIWLSGVSTSSYAQDGRYDLYSIFYVNGDQLNFGQESNETGYSDPQNKITELDYVRPFYLELP